MALRLPDGKHRARERSGHNPHVPADLKRIYIPNRYGMQQPKWITRIEAIAYDGAGYWVDRGWSKEARPQILAIIDSVAQDQIVAGRVPIGGIAWAGDRGADEHQRCCAALSRALSVLLRSFSFSGVPAPWCSMVPRALAVLVPPLPNRGSGPAGHAGVLAPPY